MLRQLRWSPVCRYARVLKADLEILGPEGQWELIQEGFMPSFGTFLLTWILLHTLQS